MASLCIFFSLLLLQPVGLSSAEFAGWFYPRVDMVRDSIYIEGGFRTEGEFVDGSWENVLTDLPAGGMLYRLNLTSSISGSNATARLEHITKTLQPQPPIFISGALFANDYGFYTYGYVVVPWSVL